MWTELWRSHKPDHMLFPATLGPPPCFPNQIFAPWNKWRDEWGSCLWQVGPLWPSLENCRVCEGGWDFRRVQRVEGEQRRWAVGLSSPCSPAAESLQTAQHAEQWGLAMCEFSHFGEQKNLCLLEANVRLLLKFICFWFPRSSWHGCGTSVEYLWSTVPIIVKWMQSNWNVGLCDVFFFAKVKGFSLGSLLTAPVVVVDWSSIRS